jgi:hypothetical protein
MSRVTEVAVPQASKVSQGMKTIHFCDAYEAPLTRAVSAAEAYRAIFGQSPAWVKALMDVRGAAVRAFRLKHPTETQYRQAEESFKRPAPKVGERLGIFTLRSIEPQEVILGEDDSHLDFRVSVLKTGEGAVTVSTAVQVNNLFGRIYITTIKPFHRLIVRSLIQNAVDAGRL